MVPPKIRALSTKLLIERRTSDTRKWVGARSKLAHHQRRAAVLEARSDRPVPCVIPLTPRRGRD